MRVRRAAAAGSHKLFIVLLAFWLASAWSSGNKLPSVTSLVQVHMHALAASSLGFWLYTYTMLGWQWQLTSSGAAASDVKPLQP